MNLELSEKQYRYLLDLVYIGNWVMNSTRENDRIREYDEVESLIFSHCAQHGMVLANSVARAARSSFTALGSCGSSAAGVPGRME